MRTNSQFGVAVAGALVALALLLGAGAAQSFTVQFTGENATGILNLEVGDTFYNITFRLETAQDIYGTSPVFDFTTSEGAEAAMGAVNAALNTEPDVMSVGPAYSIVYEVPFEFLGDIAGIDFVSVREAVFIDTASINLGTPAWLQRTDPQARPYEARKTYANFTVVPEPHTALLMGLGLAGLTVAGGPRRERNHTGKYGWYRSAKAGGTK